MDEITTSNHKDKRNIKPYRKYQFALILLSFFFIISLCMVFSKHRELNMLLIQNDNMSVQLQDKKHDNEDYHYILSRLEVNYFSLYKLQDSYTTDIIKTIGEFNTLISWIENVEDEKTENPQFHICYKATKDGDTFQSFYEMCNAISPLVFLLETVDGFRFGVYISEPVLIKNQWVEDTKAFIFSFDFNKQYKIIKAEHAFYDSNKNFPLFGNSDINIVEGFLNHSKSVCEFPRNFESDANSLGDYQLTGGIKNIRLKEMEVLSIYFHSAYTYDE